MKLLTVPLSKTRLAPLDHRLRPVDDRRVAAIAASFRAGSDQIAPFLAYPHGDEYCIFGGCTSYSAFNEARGSESGVEALLLIFETKSAKELVLWAARADNHESLKEETWAGIFRRFKADFPTQKAMAESFGVSESWISMCLNPEKYKNRHQEVYPVNSRSELYLGSQASPLVQTEIPLETGENSHATQSAAQVTERSGIPAVGSKPALGGSHGADDREAVELPQPKFPSLHAPLLSSYLDALESAAEPLLKRSMWLKAENAMRHRNRLEALYWRLGDLLMSLDGGPWTGEAPKARFKKPLPSYSEGQRVSVETHGESVILKVLEDGRFRIKDSHGEIQVVSPRMVLAAERMST